MQRKSSGEVRRPGLVQPASPSIIVTTKVHQEPMSDNKGPVLSQDQGSCTLLILSDVLGQAESGQYDALYGMCNMLREGQDVYDLAFCGVNDLDQCMKHAAEAAFFVPLVSGNAGEVKCLEQMRDLSYAHPSIRYAGLRGYNKKLLLRSIYTMEGRSLIMPIGYSCIERTALYGHAPSVKEEIEAEVHRLMRAVTIK